MPKISAHVSDLSVFSLQNEKFVAVVVITDVCSLIAFGFGGNEDLWMVLSHSV